MGKDEYEVTFLGNADTSWERAFDFAMLRAAEIALRQQAKSFTIADVVNLSSARKYLGSSQDYRTASPYLSTGRPIFSAPEQSGTMSESWTVVIPGQQRVFYKPGVRLKIKLSPEPPTGVAYDPAKVGDRLKHKYGLN